MDGTRARKDAKAILRGVAVRVLQKLCIQQDEQLRDIRKGMWRLAMLGGVTETLEVVEVRRMREIWESVEMEMEEGWDDEDCPLIVVQAW